METIIQYDWAAEPVGGVKKTAHQLVECALRFFAGWAGSSAWLIVMPSLLSQTLFSETGHGGMKILLNGHALLAWSTNLLVESSVRHIQSKEFSVKVCDTSENPRKRVEQSDDFGEKEIHFGMVHACNVKSKHFRSVYDDSYQEEFDEGELQLASSLHQEHNAKDKDKP